MNTLEKLETVGKIVGDLNVILGYREPRNWPLLSLEGKRAELSVHSVQPTVASVFPKNSHSRVWLSGEFRVAAFQVHDFGERTPLVAGILALNNTVSRNGTEYVGAFIHPDELHTATRILLGEDRLPELLTI
jgi:hypothetical protein